MESPPSSSLWDLFSFECCSGQRGGGDKENLQTGRIGKDRSTSCTSHCMPLSCNERAQQQNRLDNELLVHCTSGNIERIKECIQNGADINVVKPPERKTALHFVAHAGASKAAKMLLESKAIVNALDSEMRTSLHIAALNGHVDMVSMLIAHEASVNSLDASEQTPLHFACVAGSIRMCQLLINSRAHVEIETNTNLQAFHYAALGGHEDVLNYLLDVEGGVSDINVLCSEDMQSALHCAASRGHVDSVELLLKRNADVDPRNASRATPLHHAAMGNHTQVATLLLKAKADPLAVARNNWTPMLMAFRQGHTECGRLIDQYIQNPPKMEARPARKR